jgi:glycosyltransferase involved in cell wall biosynthesis
MKKIRVLHTEWSDGWGGQEIRIINEMEALRKKGVELFLATRENAKIKNEAVKKDFKVFTLPFNGNLDFKTIFGLMKIIKKYDIDIVNTHSGKDTWVGGIAAKLSGVKFIRTRHLSNPINPSRLNFINELADFIITTGESVKEDMIRKNRIKPEKIESIPTGVDEEIFNPIKYDRKKEREKLSIKENQIAIGILAVLRRFKRHDIFLKMAKEISKKYPEVVFLIAGEGPQKENIKKLIKEFDLEEKVKMLGHTKEPEKFLSAIDILVLTSDSKEGVPQSVIQGLMMQKCVIATDVGSVKDLYNGKNFILIKPNDLDSLIKAVENVIEDKELRDRYSKNARDFVVHNFSKSKMAEKILNIYKRILK